MTPSTSISRRFLDGLKGCGLRFYMSVPCKNLAGLISELETDPEVTYVPVTREEEGIGVAAGAFLGGELAVLLMQNSGLGNAINALASLMGYYRIPVVLLISHRGMPGETIGAQVPMGRATEGLLEVLDIPFFAYRQPEDLGQLNSHVSYARVSEKPVAVLVSPTFWSTE